MSFCHSERPTRLDNKRSCIIDDSFSSLKELRQPTDLSEHQPLLNAESARKNKLLMVDLKQLAAQNRNIVKSCPELTTPQRHITWYKCYKVTLHMFLKSTAKLTNMKIIVNNYRSHPRNRWILYWTIHCTSTDNTLRRGVTSQIKHATANLSLNHNRKTF